LVWRVLIGPLVFIKTPEGISFEEQVIISLKNGEKRIGNVIKLSEDITTIQVYEGTSGISLNDVKTEFIGKPLMLKLAPTMLRSSF
jgi:V/A-type H+-transporting ATPase subunit B